MTRYLAKLARYALALFTTLIVAALLLSALSWFIGPIRVAGSEVVTRIAVVGWFVSYAVGLAVAFMSPRVHLA